MCCNIYYRVTIYSVFILIFLIPCIIFNVGVGREWNKNAMMSKCLIVDYVITESKCGYDCNVRIVCEDIEAQGVTCYKKWDICWKICYNGYVIVDNFPTEIFILKDDSMNLIDSKLNDKYPINTTVTCYHYNNVTKFSNEENAIYFGFYIFFTIISCSILLISLLYELHGKNVL